jgi:polar amino acid transport system permease protein
MDTLQTFFALLPVLLRGALSASLIGAGALLLATVGGALLAVAHSFGGLRARAPINVFVEWMRNVPALAHLFLIYFGLSYLGVNLPPWLAAILGLGLVGSAILTDVFRSALKALHLGQREAGLTVGLSPRQVLTHILLPQAWRMALPAYANYVSQLLKDTSIASAIAVPEIMFLARNLVTSTFETTLIYLAVILLYAAMILPIGYGFAGLERKLGISR